MRKLFLFFAKNREKFIDKYIIICYTYTWIFSGAKLPFDRKTTNRKDTTRK